MKIFDVKQIAEADKVSIERQGITSEDLMERAAGQVFRVIHDRLNNNPVPIKIFCGIGNNGGDGLVIGRLLIEEGYNVSIYIVNYTKKRSPDFLANYHKIQDLIKAGPVLLKDEQDFPKLEATDFVIDAIFGIGLNRPAEGWVADLIMAINKANAFILAVDMPSGLYADRIPEEGNAVVKANFTLTFQAPKLVFFLPQTAAYAGEVQVLDIGLDPKFLADAPALAYLINKPEALTMYRPRKKFSHKGTYGHSLIIGGSYGKIGSISLTATAALRAGAGMVTIYSPSCGYEILQGILPEAMVITDKGERELEDIQFDMDPAVICFGMGAGTSAKTVTTFKRLLKTTKKPMVIDADGINILSKQNSLLEFLTAGSVLTPHPGELKRLIGEWKDDFEKLEKARKFSDDHSVILILKDAHTIIVSGNNMYVNNTGNPGMATAGAGDVLAGVITALISQQYEPLTAAILGTYLHGKAGDFAAASLGEEALIAGELSRFLGSAYKELYENVDHSAQR